jgi:hypothetical protein
MSITEEGVGMGVCYDEVKAYRGYTLFTPVGSRDIYLVDMRGQVVHTWRTPFELGTHAVLLPNGNLLCGAKVPESPLADFDGAAGRLLEMDWDGNIIWQYEDLYMHHDFCRMPNGNTILIHWVPTPKNVVLEVRGGLPNTEKDGVMWSDSLREINPAGEVVWEWLAYEHLDTEVDIICPLCFRSEWTHANSFAVSPYGSILVSFMKTNSIAIVNRGTGNIDWRWGGFLKLAHPHDVSWVDDKSVMVLGCGGHVAGFDVSNSEILQISMETNDIVWQYMETWRLHFYTSCKGGFQRLPNGNVLICEGDTGRIFEVVESGEIVWEFVNPFYHPSPVYGQKSKMLFGASRYGSDYGGLKGNAPETVVKIESKPRAEKPRVSDTSKRDEALRSRLASLGY